MEQTLMDKLTILADSAKYDVACTSSGASRTARAGILGSCYAPGCCHAFTADGRCVSLLKVLMTNCCAFDCSYCVNRKSNDIPRATFTPRELAELTVEFYRRNYIEGLFLSSAVLGTPDYTTERMLAALRLLRGEYRFGGYIHAKAIPGTSPELLQQLGYLADRLSVNVELPSERSLNLLAPDKGRHSIFRPMKQIAVSGAQSKQELAVYRHAPRFAPAGVLAPKSKADLAFIMHSLSWLASNGTAAIVCFPGILYRGGAEKKIRQYLIDNNFIDCIIQLPDNLFFGTSIATCIMVLKKSKTDNATLFIDASRECVKVTNSNKLTEENIQTILDAYTQRADREYFAKLVPNGDIGEQDYNLSVSTYVEQEDTREVIDITQLNEEIRQIVAREQNLREEIEKIVAEIEG